MVHILFNRKLQKRIYNLFHVQFTLTYQYFLSESVAVQRQGHTFNKTKTRIIIKYW